MKNLTVCPICESDRIIFSYAGHTNRNPTDQKAWPVYRCEKCSHGFINPQPEWNEIKPYYSETYEAYEVDHGSSASTDKEVLESAHISGKFRHLPLPIAGKKLLDVGCGGGYFLRIAKQLGAQVEGVEPSEAGFAQSRSQGLNVFNGMLPDYVAHSEKHKIFDIITSNHVLEHTPSPVDTLRHMRKLLADGGLIWIAVPNAQCYFSRKLGAHWHSTDLPYHLQQFSAKSLALAGQLAGLSVRRQYTYSLPSATGASLRAYLRKRYLFPQRISEKLSLLNDVYVPKLAEKIDRRADGEAIITEFEVR